MPTKNDCIFYSCQLRKRHHFWWASQTNIRPFLFSQLYMSWCHICTSSAKTFIYENLLGFLENWESFQHLHLCHHLWYHYPPLKTNPQQTYQARKEEENSVHNHKKNYQMLRDSLLAFLCFIKQIRHHLKKTDYWMWISPHFQRGSSPIAKNGHEPLYSYRQHFFLILQRRI